MRQVTLRLPDRLADELKGAARQNDQSVNAFATSVISAAVDPELENDELARLRARLRRAGLLATHGRAVRPPPPEEELARARAAAGKGKPLSEYISEGRR